MCQKLRMYGTFWYFRHLWPSDLVGSLMGLFCNLNTLVNIEGIWWKCIPSGCLTSVWEWSGPLLGDLGNHFRCLRLFWSVLGYNWGVKVSKGILRGLLWCISSNFLQFSQVTNRPIDIFQLIRRSQMPEITKCPTHMQLLTHWEALGEVSVLS